MQHQTEVTPWRTIKNQITGLSVFKSQIENLRSLLAEDWQIRVTRPEVSEVAAVESRLSVSRLSSTSDLTVQGRSRNGRRASPSQSHR
jgi:hypothetical protein